MIQRRHFLKSTTFGAIASGLAGCDVGVFAIQKGFSYAVCDAQRQDLLVRDESRYIREPAL
ncbi:asparaginase [Xanthomonas fragariae]|uniref:Asparaginase n=1 Tax=Xanthomonas fragariae TaxID=48664 RepID=A0A1Y6HIT5_9XANT|nr:hypothetical protein BER92_04210 [Xanthomonas fragariae]ENZ94427.1 asparaginase [Xanthomonas fragariae LMG 25863]AOD17454.1 hypothetical protein BER93_04210 [Xanthomonas fragariae]SMQ96459.1 asparaginase [Xanthomonas fragariae]SMR00363.1 hypothetical protein PD885_03141 [Xanthomonas fragariae]